MRIRSKKIGSKIEYAMKRNKCPCCTRLNHREELIRRAEVTEAMNDGEAVLSGYSMSVVTRHSEFESQPHTNSSR